MVPGLWDTATDLWVGWSTAVRGRVWMVRRCGDPRVGARGETKGGGAFAIAPPHTTAASAGWEGWEGWEGGMRVMVFR